MYEDSATRLIILRIPLKKYCVYTTPQTEVCQETLLFAQKADTFCRNRRSAEYRCLLKIIAVFFCYTNNLVNKYFIKLTRRINYLPTLNSCLAIASTYC